MGALEKARIYNPDQPTDGFYVPFNPNTLTYSVGSNLDQGTVPRTGTSPLAQMQGDPTGQTGQASLSATLFFYTYENETTYQDVRKEVNRIRAFVRRSNDGNGVISKRIAFAWGTLAIVGTLEYINISYQMFASDGTPVQAETSITIVGEDPDITASSINHAASAAIQKDAIASWRDLGLVPDSVRWLFS